MVYHQISSKFIIASLFDRFNLPYSDWVHRAGEWIADGLGKMKLHATLELHTQPGKVISYRCKLPCDIKLLKGIEYEGYRLPRAGYINQHDTCTIEDRYHPTANYTLNKNSYINTSFETGDVRFHYLRAPVEHIPEYDIYLPMIPDDEWVHEALLWFILRNELGRGYVHPVFNYQYADAMWKENYPKAQNSVMICDSDARELHRQLWSSMLINEQAWSNGFFDNSNSSPTISTDTSTELFAVNFVFNIIGVNLTLTPDSPIILDNTSSVVFHREKGTYSYTASKIGYQTQIGSIQVYNTSITKRLTMLEL